MDLVFLYGPPAVGKFTVGTELARRTGFKLFHNHLTVNLVSAVFERDSPIRPSTPRVLDKLVDATRFGQLMDRFDLFATAPVEPTCASTRR